MSGRVLVAALAVAALDPGPAAAEVRLMPFQGYCATDPGAFAPGLGKIVHGPTLMEENPDGIAIFTIEGTRARAVGVALADGLTWCILWATLVKGEPS